MGALVLLGIALAIVISQMGGKKSAQAPEVKAPTSPKTITQDVEDVVKQAEAKHDDSNVINQNLDSPFQRASNSQWMKYVGVQKRGKKSTKTATGWGYWLMHPTAITDAFPLLQPGTINSAEWQAKFFGSAQMQYDAFRAHSALQGAAILSRYEKDYIPAEVRLSGHVQPYRISLSGLLGVAHRVGMGGLEKWLTKEKMAATNDVFIYSNGIF